MKPAVLVFCAALASSPAFAADNAHWGYHGKDGPAHWGDLDPAYATCKTGQMQSPIDLAKANERANVAVALNYLPVPLTILNNGHTIQFTVENGSAITLDRISYKLSQVHFHTPSEHHNGGATYPLEAHFVHKSDAKTLAVIGVMFEVGAANTTLQAIIDNMPKTKTPAHTIAGVVIDPASLQPGDHGLVRYMGSLTTPPCDEGVNWMVMTHAMTASKAQIDALAAVMGANARPLQKPGHRLIVEPK